MSTMERLLQIAGLVRAALERHSRSTDDVAFQNFPIGCCGPASELLGRYLLENGFDDVLYVTGKRDGRSHAWVETSGMIVDITADQFGQLPVVVAVESQWHKSWRVDQLRRPPICSKKEWPSYPSAAWQAIQKNIGPPINENCW